MGDDLDWRTRRPAALAAGPLGADAAAWNDLLFAHWPVPASSLAALIPEGLQVDTFQDTAWLGIMPFWMDKVKVHGLPPILGARSFPRS